MKINNIRLTGFGEGSIKKKKKKSKIGGGKKERENAEWLPNQYWKKAKQTQWQHNGNLLWSMKHMTVCSF